MSTSTPEVWHHVREVRLDVADQVEGFDEEQAATPSLVRAGGSATWSDTWCTLPRPRSSRSPATSCGTVHARPDAQLEGP